jgi:hypothetical protein
MKLEIDAHGYYLAPFIRLTLGASGERALIVRSQWFLTGDLQQMTYIGFEFGRP